MIVTPLGTVSPYCKNNKNCPGFLVESNNKKLLIDCGNGISRLLKIPNDLHNLVIIISHFHKDHYGDLSCIAYASLVYKNLGILKDKIKVYIPNDFLTSDFNCLSNFLEENYMEFIPYESNSQILHGDMVITFSINPHQLLTYSIKISTKKQSLVYSSDTGYKNNSLETFAENCDLLICESTFLKKQHKKEDYHLYAHEAAQIAKNANVKALGLTHFLPEIDCLIYVKEAKCIFKNTFACKESKKIILEDL